MAFTVTRLLPAGDIPILPAQEVTPGYIQILPVAVAALVLRQDLILLHHGHQVQVTPLPRVPVRHRLIQVATQAVAAAEGDNII